MALYNEDCVSFIKTISDDWIDLVLTDPPYGNNTTYGRLQRTIRGDESPLLALYVIEECYRVLKPNSALICFLEIKHLWLFESFIRRYSRFNVRDVVIWNKGHPGMGYGFRKQYEAMLVLEKGLVKYAVDGVGNLFTHPRTNVKEHPHAKPVELLTKLIRHTTKPGGLVLDPFMGSGSTGVACKETHRHFIGVEIDEHHFGTATRRIEAA